MDNFIHDKHDIAGQIIDKKIEWFYSRLIKEDAIENIPEQAVQEAIIEQVFLKVIESIEIDYKDGVFSTTANFKRNIETLSVDVAFIIDQEEYDKSLNNGENI